MPAVESDPRLRNERDSPLVGSVLAAIVYRGITMPAKDAERALLAEQEEHLKSRVAAS
jgi:hypothetical protein